MSMLEGGDIAGGASGAHSSNNAAHSGIRPTNISVTNIHFGQSAAAPTTDDTTTPKTNDETASAAAATTIKATADGPAPVESSSISNSSSIVGQQHPPHHHNHPNNTTNTTKTVITNGNPPQIFYDSSGSSAGSNNLHATTSTSIMLPSLVRISVPKMEQDDDDEDGNATDPESDPELSQLEQNKNAAQSSDTQSGNGTGASSSSNSVLMRVNRAHVQTMSVPRPMSWEGELSDGADDDGGDEDNSMDIKQDDAVMAAVCLAPASERLCANELRAPQSAIGIMSLNSTVKIEQQDPQVHDHQTSFQLQQQQLHQQQHQQQNPPGPIPVNLLPPHHQQQQGLLLQHRLSAGPASNSSKPPANHSPDSAIHSVYTHSSPSQSPITSRHSALQYASSLSRNNSDASHSSCYSYSSEFSPTHSPIQGRHNMYPGNSSSNSVSSGPAGAGPGGGGGGGNGPPFNGSPLHHSVLYRPLLDVQQQQQQQQHQHLMQHMQHQQRQQHSQTQQRRTSHPNASADGSADNNSSNSGAAASIGDLKPSAVAAAALGLNAGIDAAAAVGAVDPASVAFSAGISRQQLINSPCPICGDKISGFHYGIFSCESCKGFFKRTVQNRKNYVCLRGAICPVTIATRKKCPACRFDKCLQRGMKLEAIREDRTRGGRSTYQCAYALPGAMLSPSIGGNGSGFGGSGSTGETGCRTGQQGTGNEQQPQQQQQQQQQQHVQLSGGGVAGLGGSFGGMACGSGGGGNASQGMWEGKSEGSSNSRSSSITEKYHSHPTTVQKIVPTLLQEIMDVEHLWQYSENERINQASRAAASSSAVSAAAADDSNAAPITISNPLLANMGQSGLDASNPTAIADLCNVADHRLYKIVKWCKSLPLFKHISIDDQICLLINSWCELLLFSCCYRSIETPGEVRISLGKSISLAQAKANGLQACIERMLNLTDHLRRLRVDKYEYVAMKVIVLLQSDTSELKEPEKVRGSQEKALQALQAYTLAHNAEAPAKFGELLLRIPELQRTCQIGKEMLTIKSKDGEDFNLLMELLRGEH